MKTHLITSVAFALLWSTACSSNTCDSDSEDDASGTGTQATESEVTDTEEDFTYSMPGTWTSSDPGTEDTLNGIFVNGDDAWVVGKNGEAYVTNGSSWKDVSVVSDGNDFTGLWGTGEGSDATIVATMTGGSYARWDTVQQEWEVETGEADKDFDAVHGSAADRWFMVGWNIGWQSDGEDFWEEDLPTNSRVNDIFDADSYAFAVGEDGLILRRTASGAWSEMESPVAFTLNAVHGNRASNIWAVGEDGVIISFDGSDWTRESPTYANGEAMAEYTLNDVYVADDGNVFIAGNRGTVLAWIDGEWEDLTSGTPRHYQAIGAADGASDVVWVAGGKGSVKYWTNDSGSEETDSDTAGR